MYSREMTLLNQTLKRYQFPTGQSLQIAQGDLTAEVVDAIVNAANSHLMHGAGVAGTIVRQGGSQIQVESSQWVQEHGLVTHTKPAYTHAGKLPCRYIIHAVGPGGGGGEELANVEAAIRSSLRLADQLGLASIAFPAISTGIYGFPKPRAAEIFLSTIQDFLTQNPNSNLKLIRLVLYDQETLRIFLKTWEQDDHFGA